MENVGTTASRRIYALIGGIASGKSVVSEILCSLGAYIIDADVISHKITAKGGKVEQLIKECFPLCVENGEIDRKKLKDTVFSDEEALKKLNGITHPVIMSEINREISLSGDKVCVVVMPLPMGLRRYTAVLNVYTPLDIRIDRLIRRDNISRELAKRIMASQLSDEEAEKISDFTFINDGDINKLKECVVKWWKIYVEN